MKPRFTPPPGILAVDHLGKSRVACRDVPHGYLAAAGGQPGILSKIGVDRGHCHPAQRPDRLLALAQARQRQAFEDRRLFGVLALRMAHDHRFGLGGNLAPEIVGLEGAPFALRLAG